MKRSGAVAGDLAIEVRVVGGNGRLGVDLAGVRIHHDRRHALRLVRDPGREELLLHRQLQSGVDGQAHVLAGHARVHDRRLVEQRATVRVTLGDDHTR